MKAKLFALIAAALMVGFMFQASAPVQACACKAPHPATR